MSSILPNPPVKQATRTASKKNSIWHPIPESAFRTNVVALARRTNGVPSDPSHGVFGLVGRENDNGMPSSRHAGGEASQTQHLLSLELEYRLASDFAFLAATEEGVKSVAAACLEEDAGRGTLILRLAANEGIPSSVQRGLEEIWESAVKSAEGEPLNLRESRPCQLTFLEGVIFRRRASRYSTRFSARAVTAFSLGLDLLWGGRRDS